MAQHLSSRQNRDPPPLPPACPPDGFAPPAAEPADISPDGVVTFDATLSPPGPDGLGLEHIHAEDGSNTLLLTDLFAGGNSTTEWNDLQARVGRHDRVLQRGDRITSVSGVTGDRVGMAQILAHGSVTLGVCGPMTVGIERWPHLIHVTLHRRSADDKLGMQVELVQKADGVQVLRVGRILGGLLGEWNQRAVAGRRFFDAVVPGSEIESVGELSDDPERMRDAVVSRDRVDLVFRRLDASVFKRMSAQLRQLKEAGGIPASAG